MGTHPIFESDLDCLTVRMSFDLSSATGAESFNSFLLDNAFAAGWVPSQADVALFGSDDEEEDEEAERIKAERIAAYNARKSAKEEKKGKVIAKSNIILDIKPWDDETPLEKMEE